LASFEVGDVILGEYKVLRELGRGGMSVVYAVRHQQLKGLFAIKALLPAVRDTPGSAERFLREAQLASRLKSDHVARVTDFRTAADGTPLLVMEFLDGHDLAAEIREHGPIPVERAVDLLLQACEGMADAHNLGIVHRDLKPANLFLAKGPDGRTRVKVLDFGVSKSVVAGDTSGSAPGSASASVPAPLTASHVPIGTPRYMSPEQIAATKDVDQRSDVWALGVILYEMLTGAPPYRGDSLVKVAAQVDRGEYPPLATELPGAPAEIDDAIRAALAKDRDERLESVEAFAKRIARFGSETALATLERIELTAKRAPPAPPTEVDARTAPTPEKSSKPSKPSRPSKPKSGSPPSRRPLVTAAIVAAAAAGIAIFLGMRTSKSPVVESEDPVCPPEDGDTGNCHRCRDEKCCAEHLACEASKACLDYKACIQGCSGHSCKSMCIQRHPDGHAIAAPLYACTDAHCAGPCTDPTAANTCSQCQFANCLDLAVKCFRDAACDTLDACNTACMGNEACKQKCRSQAPSVTQTMFNDFFSCKMNYCTRACAE
jgi:serine/threonine protein kinase